MTYGWIAICVLVFAVLLALATPLGTFADCTYSTTVSDIPNNVTNLSYTFNNCTALTIMPPPFLLLTFHLKNIFLKVAHNLVIKI